MGRAKSAEVEISMEEITMEAVGYSTRCTPARWHRTSIVAAIRRWHDQWNGEGCTLVTVMGTNRAVVVGLRDGEPTGAIYRVWRAGEAP